MPAGDSSRRTLPDRKISSTILLNLVLHETNLEKETRMRNAPTARIALTTAASVEEARTLARTLVERRLAACVNLLPSLTSIYRWQGAIEEASETLLIIKTTAEQLPELETALRELHSYDVPELLALSIDSSSQPYLDWLLSSVGGSNT
jgi:periplasmic divalent cation tolerance protein